MLWIEYFKGEPNEFVIAFSGGEVRRTGPGLAFFYWRPSTSIAVVPLGTIDLPFLLNETTGNFQTIAVQGQLTYRITDPMGMAKILNFTIDPVTRRYKSEDHEKLGQRIVNEVQSLVRGELQKISLDEALRQSVQMAGRVVGALKESKALSALGVEIIALYIVSVRPTPEMAKALEAEYREALQTKADQAIYRRRALAVEQERQIKENELNTSISLEEKRCSLVELEGQNNLKQADFDARSNTARLAPFRELPSRTLLALAMKELAGNAEKIGNLTITPDILASLLKSRRQKESV